MQRTQGGQTFTLSAVSGQALQYDPGVGGGGGLYAYDGASASGVSVTLSVNNGYVFDISSFQALAASGTVSYALTFGDGTTSSGSVSGVNDGVGNSNLSTLSPAITGIKQIVFTSTNYAIFQTINLVNIRPLTYSLTYNGNSNTSGAVPTDSNAYSPGSNASVANNTGGLARTGYVFNGWNTLANGAGTHYAVSANITMNSDTTLYAEWVAVPIVTGVSPSSGPTTGGTTVTITGTGLTAATAVNFGATNASGYTVNSSTQITATSPAGAAGTVDITVTTAGGTTITNSNDHFTYVAAPTVTSVSPSSGSTAGGTSVVITGTNFSAVTAVKFGATTAGSFTVNSNTQITATSPGGSAGAVDVTVVSPGGTSATNASDQFIYVASPTVTAVSPSTGPTSGGTTVTITGTNLTGASSVTFGATPASIVSNTATSISATSPAGAAGTVDVRVTTVAGTSATSASDQFTYVAAPTVTAVSPGSGPTGGGTTVTITGTNLSNATAVSFGGTTGSIVSNTATSMTATSPAGSAGAVDVTVTTAGGTSATSSNDRFTYVAAPTVTSISPSSGSTAGGTSVVVTGTNFSAATAVKFGTTTAGSFTIDSGTQITVSSPAASAGTVDITVVSPGGTSATGSADQFTYIAAPAISSIAPSAGPTAGGTSVTITGTNFTGATSVKFGATSATGFTVNSATQITATSPSGSAGTVDITVTTGIGTSSTGSSDQFTYTALPTVTSISPSSGPTAGTTSVVLTGTGFTGATAVKFGASNATGFTVNSATQITATAPAGSAGTVDITVTTAGGTNSTASSDQYTYIAAPTITGISPSSGSTLGGTTVVITGQNLTGATAVRFGGSNATSFTVNSATQITATAPTGAAGTVDVTVITAGGTSATGAQDQFTYNAKTFVGALPGGGSATASFTGGGPTCGFTTAQFVTVSSVSNSPPAGYSFNQGLFDFRLTACNNGQPVTISITYPTTPGSVYWKYGPTAADTSNHWYQLPGASVSGNTVTFSITDGGLGDDDRTPDGTIIDAGGPGAPGAQAAIPTLSEWALIMLSLLVLGAGFSAMPSGRFAARRP